MDVVFEYIAIMLNILSFKFFRIPRYSLSEDTHHSVKRRAPRSRIDAVVLALT